MIANFAKDTKLVVGCKAGPRSLQAAALAGRAGYTDVVDMRGGFQGERDALGRVAARVGPSPACPSKPRLRPNEPTSSSPRSAGSPIASSEAGFAGRSSSREGLGGAGWGPPPAPTNSIGSRHSPTLMPFF